MCLSFWRKSLGKSPWVESEVTWFFGGHVAEVVTTVSYTFSLADGDEEEDDAEPFWLFRGEYSEGLGPVRFDWEAREVKSKT